MRAAAITAAAITLLSTAHAASVTSVGAACTPEGYSCGYPFQEPCCAGLKCIRTHGYFSVCADILKTVATNGADSQYGLGSHLIGGHALPLANGEAEEAVAEVTEEIQGAIEEAAEVAKETAAEVSKGIEEGAEHAQQTTAELAEQIQEAAEQAGEVAEETAEQVQAAAEQAEELAEEEGKAAEALTEELKETASEVAETVASTMETAIETVAEAASAAEKQLEKTIGAVAEEASRAEEAVKEGLVKAEEAMWQAIKDLGESASAGATCIKSWLPCSTNGDKPCCAAATCKAVFGGKATLCIPSNDDTAKPRFYRL